jgi:hypothetical protein
VGCGREQEIEGDGEDETVCVAGVHGNVNPFGWRRLAGWQFGGWQFGGLAKGTGSSGVTELPVGRVIDQQEC